MISSMLVSCALIVSLTSCATGVSQEEYNKVVSERDALASEIAALEAGSVSQNSESSKPKKEDTKTVDEPKSEDIAVTTYSLHSEYGRGER